MASPTTMTLFRGKYRVESARLPRFDYSQPGFYFVTICTKEFQPFFGMVRAGKMEPNDLGLEAEQQLLRVPTHYVDVDLDCQVVMPNHVHAIFHFTHGHVYSPAPTPSHVNLATVVGAYKAGVTRWATQNADFDFEWQPRFYDHVIRKPGSLARIREYILANPEEWIGESLPPRLQSILWEDSRDATSGVSTPRAIE